MLAWCLAAAAVLAGRAVMAEPTIDQEVRNCIANADSAAALAVCEEQGLKAWRTRVAELHQALLSRLPAAQQPPYVAAQDTWEAYRQREFNWIDHSFTQRRDGLGAPLAAGAKSELLRQRAAQLSTHLGNLSGAESK